MARGNRLVQSPGDRRSPNACRPVPAASSTGTPLDKSLFPGHTVHSDASSEDEGDNSPGRQEHQHSSCDGVPILRGNIPSTPYDQIPPADAQYPGAATRTESNPCVCSPTSSSFQGTEHVVATEMFSATEPTNVPRHERPNLNSNNHASTDNLDSADGLDPFELYEIGQLLCAIARTIIAKNQRPTQSHISGWFPVPPNVPRPPPTSPRPTYDHPPADRHLPTPVVQLPPQPHSCSNPGRASPNAAFPVVASTNQLHLGPATPLSPSLGFEGTRVNSNDHEPLPPDHLSSGLSVPNVHFVGVAAAASSSHGNATFDRHVPVPQVTAPGPEAAPVGSYPNPRICPTCHKKFIRSNDLLDHMHKHNGVKRHSCKFCGVRIAYRNNLIEHQKKCKDNSGL